MPLWQRVSIRVTEQFGQPGANCAGRPTVQVKRRIKQVEDGCLNLGQADWVGRGYQVDPQVAVDPGRQLRVVFGVKVECGTQIAARVRRNMENSAIAPKCLPVIGSCVVFCDDLPIGHRVAPACTA